MSIKKIEMPHLGESVTEASISLWLVNVGDRVNKYDPIAEAVSDKVTTEIPSNFSGIVKEFLVEIDTEVPIGTTILTIETDDENGKIEPKEEILEPKQEETTAPSMKTRYSPAVLRIAQEKNIDLTQVEGTGKHGRITRKDVLSFEEPIKAQTTPTQESSVGRVPADGVRKAIAKKMVQSTSEIPHAWMMVEADVTNIVRLRNHMKDSFKQQEGVSLSYFPFFMKAVAQALKKHPVLNASWDDGTIQYHSAVNMSVAVATDEHLFVPVIHDATQYSVAGLAKELNRLKQAVDSATLTSADSQGGTFTLNNTGVFGSIQSMGIINHPQAAILQVESITKRLVPTEDGGFKPADIVNLCLSIDHRLIDGLQAGRFLQEVKANLARMQSENDVY